MKKILASLDGRFEFANRFVKANARLALLTIGISLLAYVPARATVIYANSAGNSGIQVFDINVAAGTETKIDQLNVPQSNGRGVVTVGDTVYYTDFGSGFVKSYTLSTHHDNGPLFAVTGARGLAAIAFDGTNIYLADYSGTNNVYKFSLTGTNLGAVQLSKCAEIHQGGTRGFCDGLEFANGGLVSNEGNGGFGGPSQYDAYSLAGGTPSVTGLITTTYGATGIAFDGTDYFVSDILHDRLGIYDASGTFLKFIALADGLHTNAIEDLSVDYNQRPDTGTPEPGTWILMISGVVAAGLRRLFKHRTSAELLGL